MTTRVALVGVGRWGRRLLPELRSRFDVDLCCTRSDDGGAAWLRECFPAIRRTTDFDAVLADEAIEAVLIATPVETHAPFAAAALAAGKHVFVEKPMATSTDEANMLVAVAAESPSVFFVGHVYLYDAALERLRGAFADVGVRSARLTWRKLGTFDSDLYWNLASHDVSTAIALVGEPVEDVELLDERGGKTPCDSAIARLRFAGGADVLIDIDRLATRAEKAVAVVTVDGSIMSWQDGLLYELRDGAFQLRYRPRSRPLARELDAFRAAIERGRAFPSTAAHGAEVVDVVELLRLAAQSVRAPERHGVSA
jgi:predicted dehydrogenase